MNAITTKGSGGPWRLRYCSIDSIQLMLHVEDILNYKLKSFNYGDPTRKTSIL